MSRFDRVIAKSGILSMMEANLNPELPIPGRDLRSGSHLIPPISNFNDFVRWIRRPAIWAFSIALALHVLWLFVSTFILVGAGGWGAGGGAGKASEVEFAVMTETELANAGMSAVSLTTPEVPEALAAGDPTTEPLEVGSISSAGDMTDMSDLGTIAVSGGGGDIGTGTVGTGTGGAGMGGAGAGGASFFGVEARGTRFAYLVDVSGSMSVGGKIEALRAQLGKSVNGLVDNAQFFIVPFSSDSRPLGNRKEWVEASQTGKRWGKTQIPLLNANGGTEPLPGFQLIFQMKPRPDAIYFMTDGEFNPDVAEEVALLNKQLKVPIHCICFSSRDSEELMRRIAAASKGTYTFVPGATGP
jgi:hypothetical protein